MNKIKLSIILSLLIATAFILSACFTKGPQALEQATTATDFTIELLSGEKVTLSKILKDKMAVLVFWTTWCPYCINEIPHVEKFYKDKQDKVAVIGINLQESKAKVASFVEKRQISYPIGVDDDGRIGALYNVRGVPTIVAIDKNNKIIYYGHSIQEMEERLR